jgi:hypothetical protein
MMRSRSLICLLENQNGGKFSMLKKFTQEFLMKDFRLVPLTVNDNDM